MFNVLPPKLCLSRSVHLVPVCLYSGADHAQPPPRTISSTCALFDEGMRAAESTVVDDFDEKQDSLASTFTALIKLHKHKNKDILYRHNYSICNYHSVAFLYRKNDGYTYQTHAKRKEKERTEHIHVQKASRSTRPSWPSPTLLLHERRLVITIFP